MAAQVASMEAKMRRTFALGYLFAIILLGIHYGYAADSSTVIPPRSIQLAQNSSWKNLTPSQQQALAPLAKEWDSMETNRKDKWLIIANKFQKMSPEEKIRVQDKMNEWVKLTPAQRTAARENYLRSNKVQPDQRTQQWQEYQQLTEEQKAQLSKRQSQKNIITNLPTPEQSKIDKLPPLKTPHQPNR